MFQGDSGGPLTVERGDKRYELIGLFTNFNYITFP